MIIMTDPKEPLILDLVQWVAEAPKPYADVMDAWRTSCPRLTVWEDAVDRGLVSRVPMAGGGFEVRASTAGVEVLRAGGRI
jgi:hypothetical protein